MQGKIKLAPSFEGLISVMPTIQTYWLVNAWMSLLSAESREVTLFGADLLDEEYLLDYTRFNQGIATVESACHAVAVSLRLKVRNLLLIW